MTKTANLANIPAFEEALIQCKEHIETARDIIITVHKNSDGDAIGSQLAFAHFLRALGKTVHLINPDAVPDNLRFLEGSDDIRVYDPETDGKLIGNVDTIFVLDVNAPHRLGEFGELVRSAKAATIVIDHHLNPAAFADLYVVDTEACSTGLLIARLLGHYAGEYLTQDIAEALYAAIMTDTGGFRFPRTTPEVHIVTARLLEAGADPVEIYEQIFNRFAIDRLHLLGRALAAIRVFHDGALILMPISAELMKEFGSMPKITEGFVNYTLSIAGAKMGLLVVDTGMEIKISLRSKGAVAVNDLAAHFGGGGHRNASGARVENGDLENTIAELVRLAGVYLSIDGA